MCYNAAYYEKKLKKLEEHYGMISVDREVWQRMITFNASAFSHPEIPCISPNHSHRIEPKIWGFRPAFTKAENARKWQAGSVNCRADDLLTKLKSGSHSMFREMVNQPVVIFINGFIEWKSLPHSKVKIPYYYFATDGEMFPIAGFSTRFNFLDKPNEILEGVTLCTFKGNSLIQKANDLAADSPDLRMPAILTPEQVKIWLDKDISPIDRLGQLDVFPGEKMKAHSIQNFLKAENRHLSQSISVLEKFDYESGKIPAEITVD